MAVEPTPHLGLDKLKECFSFITSVDTSPLWTPLFLVDTLIPLLSRGFLLFVRTQCTVQVQSYSSQTAERGALSCAVQRGGGSAALSVLHQTKRLQTLGRIKADLKGRRPLLYPKIPSQKSPCLESQNRP